jgi:hypothetical protein
VDGKKARVGRSRRRIRWVLALLAAVMVLGNASPVFADTFVVRAVRTSDGWRWRDASGDKHTYIDPGDYIRWRNPTTQTHNVRAYGGNWSYSRTLEAGESARRQFNNSGTYKYRCTIHSSLVNGRCSGQCGVVHV